LFDLDEPVDRLLPELAERQVLRQMDGPLDETVPAARAITTRDLLTFTFGFGMVLEMFMSPTPWPVVRATEDFHLATIGPPNPSVQPDPDTWMANLGTLPLLAQPGERWMYNTGAQVLGVLVARATGEPLADAFRTRLFQPLGMHDTGFWTAQTDRLTTAYMPTPDGLVVIDLPDGSWSRSPAFVRTSRLPTLVSLSTSPSSACRPMPCSRLRTRCFVRGSEHSVSSQRALRRQERTGETDRTACWNWCAQEVPGS